MTSISNLSSMQAGMTLMIRVSLVMLHLMSLHANPLKRRAKMWSLPLCRKLSPLPRSSLAIADQITKKLRKIYKSYKNIKTLEFGFMYLNYPMIGI